MAEFEDASGADLVWGDDDHPTTQPDGPPAMPDSNDLRTTLSNLVTSAVNLRVSTVVGDVTLGGTLETMSVSVPSTAKSIVTDINLVAGDVTTIVSQDLLDAAHADLLAKHYAAVDSAQKNVKDNIAAFVDLMGKLRDAVLPAPTERPAKPVTITQAQ